MRGISTGASFRRLVAKSLARQFSKVVERACAPFQFALSARAGPDCVGHVIRALTDASRIATVLSVDGIALRTSSAWPPTVREGHVFGAITLHLAGHRAVWEGNTEMPSLFSLGTFSDISSHSWTTCVSYPSQTGRAQGTTHSEKRRDCKANKNCGTPFQRSRPAMHVQVLFLCARFRCHHLLQTLPPDQPSRPKKKSIPRTCHEARPGNERGLAWIPRWQVPTEHGTVRCVASHEDGTFKGVPVLW